MFPVIFADVWCTRNAKGAVAFILSLLALITLSHFDGLTFKTKTLYPSYEAMVPKKPRVLLTMFTSFKNKKEKYRTYCNTLRNWALFLPQIQPLLFTYETDENLIKLAKSLGWLIADVPRLGKNKVPIWKDMYFAAQNHSNSVFYGWFNGDLLFDDGLINTLTAVEHYLNQLDRTLIVGQRTNFELRNREIWNKSDVTKAAKEGTLYHIHALDYFILARNQYVWDQVPDVVIGRTYYDNFLVYVALKNKLSVVDASKTVLTLHQTGKDGNLASEKTINDPLYNSKILGKFNISQGGTDKAPFFTQHGPGKEKIEVWQRPIKEMVKLSKLKC